MAEPYQNWNDDLLYSTELATVFEPPNENTGSPVRPRRYLASTSNAILNLTPSLLRSPLSTLKETPEGLLYSPNP